MINREANIYALVEMERWYGLDMVSSDKMYGTKSRISLQGWVKKQKSRSQSASLCFWPK